MPDMRYAPPAAMRVVHHGGGFNQTSVRTYNERLVMSLLRQHDSLSRMDLGQKSGLSAQTISVIVRALERDKLILPGEAQRGRVGPPSTPMSLNADGAFAIGIKIGAKSTDVVLIDFVGAVRRHCEHDYRTPSAEEILAGLATSVAEVKASLPAGLANRLVGVGISLPADFDEWPGDAWHAIDLEGVVSAHAGLPTYIQNDATAAAAAEGTFGAARTLDDFIYFFVDVRSESRVILNHHIYAGRRAAPGEGSGVATLSDLEAALLVDNRDVAGLWRATAEWRDFGPALDAWIARCAASLAGAVLSAASFVDIGTAIIDGRFPDTVRTRVVEETVRIMAEGAGGERIPSVIPGTAGAFAKSVGAASVPFHSRFMVEHVGLAAR
jgi:predicted NBD/HSP70 family sugar kinase